MNKLRVFWNEPLWTDPVVPPDSWCLVVFCFVVVSQPQEHKKGMRKDWMWNRCRTCAERHKGLSRSIWCPTLYEDVCWTHHCWCEPETGTSGSSGHLPPACYSSGWVWRRVLQVVNPRPLDRNHNKLQDKKEHSWLRQGGRHTDTRMIKVTQRTSDRGLKRKKRFQSISCFHPASPHPSNPPPPYTRFRQHLVQKRLQLTNTVFFVPVQLKARMAKALEAAHGVLTALFAAAIVHAAFIDIWQQQRENHWVPA